MSVDKTEDRLNGCAYHIYPRHLDTSTPYHIYSKIGTLSTIYYPMLRLKIAWCMANSVDPVEMLYSATSHVGLHCFLRPVCLNTYGKYGLSLCGGRVEIVWLFECFSYIWFTCTCMFACNCTAFLFYGVLIPILYIEICSLSLMLPCPLYNQPRRH